MDIGGIENSLLETTTNQEVVIQPWFDDDWGQEVIQQKITKKIIDNENDALLKYPQNFQGGYSIINQDNRNAWGLPRGYAIHPGYSPIHNVSNIHRVHLSAALQRYTDGRGIEATPQQC